MSSYADDNYERRPRRPRDDRAPPAPYPESTMDYGPNERRPRQTRFDNDGPPPPPPPNGAGIPPPPMGSAMKREGSRSRVPDLKPQFPDEASYLNGGSPDLERKNRARDKAFRDRRDGYESEEGEMLRSAKPRRPSYSDVGPAPKDRRAPQPRDDRYDDRRRPAPPASELEPYDRRRPPPKGGDSYDSRRPPPRRRDDPYDDDDLPPRRRGPEGVEYGKDPVKPLRRSNTDKDKGRDRDRRRGKYDSDSSDDDYDRPRRRRSEEPPRRRRDKYDDDKYTSSDRDARRRREEIYDRDRDSRRKDDRRRRDKYDDYSSDDDYDRRDRRDRDRKKPPRKLEIGGRDVGPMMDQGKKYWGLIAPIATPLVMNYLRNNKK